MRVEDLKVGRRYALGKTKEVGTFVGFDLHGNLLVFKVEEPHGFLVDNDGLVRFGADVIGYIEPEKETQ
jgi:hypothetical protein